MIAALFVETNGVYFGLPNVDPWDETRDATKYNGPYPVVAHPPCQRWSQLAESVQAKYGYPIGDDGGLFESALNSVESFGGVLEHPASSKAWTHFGIWRPSRGEWVSTRKGWTTEISQSTYGHDARKNTWLYYVGKIPPMMDWSIKQATGQVSRDADWTGRLRILSKLEARTTPIRFRDKLIEMAEQCRL